MVPQGPWDKIQSLYLPAMHLIRAFSQSPPPYSRLFWASASAHPPRESLVSMLQSCFRTQPQCPLLQEALPDAQLSQVHAPPRTPPSPALPTLGQHCLGMGLGGHWTVSCLGHHCVLSSRGRHSGNEWVPNRKWRKEARTSFLVGEEE